MQEEKEGLVKQNVWIDYRNNILVDKDNPVLAFKANRDRYFESKSQTVYAGLSHIGSINSEDAITWNFMRSICLENDYFSIEKVLGFELKNPKVLLWTLSFDENSRDIQYIVGSIIRAKDGRYKGQITEPDVIIETDDFFIVVECKLGEKGKYPNHLWETHKDSEGPKRRTYYFENTENLFLGKEGYYNATYQLYRMVYYTNEIAKKINKKGIFVSLANQTWWNIKRDNISPNDIWEEFCQQINPNEVLTHKIFWQDFEFGNNEKLNFLADYLKTHRCLY